MVSSQWQSFLQTGLTKQHWLYRFQRPNTLHAVATESNSLVFGQHFFPTSAIRSVVMGWVHTAFLSWAITNVEHKDMRVLLLRLMAYWKKVITAGENLEGTL